MMDRWKVGTKVAHLPRGGKSSPDPLRSVHFGAYLWCTVCGRASLVPRSGMDVDADVVVVAGAAASGPEPLEYALKLHWYGLGHGFG